MAMIARVITALSLLCSCGPPPAAEEPNEPPRGEEPPSDSGVGVAAPPGPRAPSTCLPPAESLQATCEGTLGTAGAAAAARAERLMVEGQALSDGDDLRGCGRVFLEAALSHPERDRAAAAAYQASRCLFEALAEEREQAARRRRPSGYGVRFERRPLSDLEEQAVRASERYLCLAAEGSDDALAIAYRRGRIYYMANHLAEGARIFRRIAFGHPEHELAEFAANLYLDCLNCLAVRDEGRGPACRTALVDEAAALRQVYCAPESGVGHEELCYMLERIAQAGR